ncbi:MAG: NAD(P)H-dependent oxidoreductase [Saprospiraceae bacterium]|nr:NAD(P)H-dependent oxidoreductase [Saprospiraceae bacterium]
MKIFAFAASNSRKSINKQLVSYTLTYFDGYDKNLIDLNDYEMPIYSIDKENENGIPQLAYQLASQIDESDLIICSFAEHNGAYTAAFKNILDWISRIKGRKVWNDKPIFAMATSTGARGGSSVLEMAAKRIPFNGGRVVDTFSLPTFGENFDPEKGIIYDNFRNELEEKINRLKSTLVFTV